MTTDAEAASGASQGRPRPNVEANKVEAKAGASQGASKMEEPKAPQGDAARNTAEDPVLQPQPREVEKAAPQQPMAGAAPAQAAAAPGTPAGTSAPKVLSAEWSARDQPLCGAQRGAHTMERKDAKGNKIDHQQKTHHCTWSDQEKGSNLTCVHPVVNHKDNDKSPLSRCSGSVKCSIM